MAAIVIPIGKDTITLTDYGDGIVGPGIQGPEISNKALKHLPHYSLFRDDDAMLCTYAKCGTNWCFEIMSMLLAGNAERSTQVMQSTLMEFMTVEQTEKASSPRIMNSHCSPRWLPLKGLRTKQVKTVLCVRNPKDAAVSLFNHLRGAKPFKYEGRNFQDFVPFYLDKYFNYDGNYADYLNAFQQLIEEGPGFPLHVLSFEDLKRDGLKEIDRLAEFLGVRADEQLKRNIVDMCSFEKMKTEKMAAVKKAAEKPIWVTSLFKEGYQFFRKGAVGDWKNWFTVAMNEYFDGRWKADINPQTMFAFKYEE